MFGQSGATVPCVKSSAVTNILCVDSRSGNRNCDWLGHKHRTNQLLLRLEHTYLPVQKGQNNKDCCSTACPRAERQWNHYFRQEDKDKHNRHLPGLLCMPQIADLSEPLVPRNSNRFSKIFLKDIEGSIWRRKGSHQRPLLWPTLRRGYFSGIYGEETRPQTSACEPGVSVLLHFAHLRHGRCQSFPMEVTFSAEMRKGKINKKSTSDGVHKDAIGWQMGNSWEKPEMCSASALRIGRPQKRNWNTLVWGMSTEFGNIDVLAGGIFLSRELFVFRNKLFLWNYVNFNDFPVPLSGLHIACGNSVLRFWLSVMFAIEITVLHYLFILKNFEEVASCTCLRKFCSSWGLFLFRVTENLKHWFANVHCRL